MSGPEGRDAEIESVLDTGFTDYRTLPPSLIADLRLPHVDTTECQLADGRIVRMDGFLATLNWDGDPREVVVLAADGGPLLGMSLLDGSLVTLEVVGEGRVTIDPLPLG